MCCRVWQRCSLWQADWPGVWELVVSGVRPSVCVWDHQGMPDVCGMSVCSIPLYFNSFLLCALHDFFWTFHNKSHNMKALVILSHLWSPYLPLSCLCMEKMNFCGSLCSLLEYFHEKLLPPDYPCKSHDHDHQWADLVMAWLP